MNLRKKEKAERRKRGEKKEGRERRREGGMEEAKRKTRICQEKKAGNLKLSNKISNGNGNSKMEN